MLWQSATLHCELTYICTQAVGYARGDKGVVGELWVTPKAVTTSEKFFYCLICHLLMRPNQLDCRQRDLQRSSLHSHLLHTLSLVLDQYLYHCAIREEGSIVLGFPFAAMFAARLCANSDKPGEQSKITQLQILLRGGLDLLRSEARERTPFCGGQ